MRFIQKTACILLLVISAQVSMSAQSPQATKPVTEQTPVERTRPENPILQKVTSVLENVLEAQKTCADENLRVMIRAHIADMLWSYDEPRARRIFADALQAAERLADQDQPPPHLGVTLFPVRTQVIRLILPHDPDWATKLIESRGEIATDFQGQSIRRDRERTNLQSHLVFYFAQRDVQRAVRAARPLAESGNSRALMQFLSFIRSKDVQAADELYRLALAKARAGQSAFFDIVTFAYYVLPSFGEGVLRVSSDKNKRDPFALSPSNAAALEQFLEFAYEAASRHLDSAAAGMSGVRLDPRSVFDFAIPKLLAPYFDRFMPERAPAFRARLQEALQRVPAEQRQYLVLSDPGTVESWLSRAETTTDPQLRDTLILRAVSRVSYGEFKRTSALIEKMSDDRIRANARFTLHQTQNAALVDDAWSALNQDDLDRAEALASEISDWRSDGGLLLRSLVGRLSRKDNARATQVLNEYQQRAAGITEPHERAMRLMHLAGVAATIDSNRGFEEMTRAVSEFNRAGFVPELERYLDNQNAGGPWRPQVNIGLSSLLGNWDLFWLGSTDMDRALGLAKTFQLKEAAALMQLNVCRGLLRTLPAAAR